LGVPIAEASRLTADALVRLRAGQLHLAHAGHNDWWSRLKLKISRLTSISWWLRFVLLAIAGTLVKRLIARNATRRVLALLARYARPKSQLGAALVAGQRVVEGGADEETPLPGRTSRVVQAVTSATVGVVAALVAGTSLD